MKQIVQDLKSGETILEEVPVPMVKKGMVLIKTHRSLVSLGTERMLVNFGKANYIQKARQQPDKVKQVLQKIKSDGLKPTVDAVFRKLNQPLPLGYCNAGEVIEVGEGVDGFTVGDRVISNGQHAEVVCVPQNLVAKIPPGVEYDHAVFTVIGAIALQGIRLLKPTLGETIVVTGLGLIGLLAIQLLKANGCEVIGLDYDEAKVSLAQSLGIKAINVSSSNPIDEVLSSTNNIGADGVLITASTKSNEVISQSAQMLRKRGRVVLVGVIGLEINRADFYEKEISFQVSCSYGPGRYDSLYEEKGLDYPIAFVRWTEKRNFQAILNTISSGQLKLDALISEVLPINDYNKIYSNIDTSKSIATILKYEDQIELKNSVVIEQRDFSKQKGVIGIIGAGNFTNAVIAPTLKELKAKTKYIVSAGGLSSTILAKKYKIANATTNFQDVLDDQDVDAVIISTRHNLHAQQSIEALDAGKHVFVEKPLAINRIELEKVKDAYQKNTKTLTVGFNRRFSPFSTDAKMKLGSGNQPLNIVATMNAGYIPAESWIHDMETGGGRIIGEACHLIDLITFFTGSLVESVVMNAMGPNTNQNTDNASILLRYVNGSQGVINYFSNGSKSYSKERIEIYNQNKTMVIDNFRKSTYYGYKSSGFKSTQDKGHKEQFKRFNNNLINGGPSIISFDEIYNTSSAAIAAVESLNSGGWVKV